MEAVTSEPDCLLAFNIFRYGGPSLTLPDGSQLERGDLVAEIHFRRRAVQQLASLGSPVRMAAGLLQYGDRDLPRFVDRLQSEPLLRQVKAAHAVTLFHRGIQRYGFTVYPVRPAWRARWFTWWHSLLMRRDRGSLPEGSSSMEIWAGRRSLEQACSRLRRPRTDRGVRDPVPPLESPGSDQAAE